MINPKHLNKRESVNLGAYYTPPYLVDCAYRLLKKHEIGRAPSELQSRHRISYAVFCLKKKKKKKQKTKKKRKKKNEQNQNKAQSRKTTWEVKKAR
ncbi:hypothetical protein VN1349_13100 [Helicobacter pylori]